MNCKGYIEVKTEAGWIREHVFVMEQFLNRKLVIGEVVHHIDGIKSNNDIKNLKLMTHGDHTALHHTGREFSIERRRKISEKNRKYTMEIAIRAREMVASGGSQRDAMRELGLPQMVVSNMIRNITYKD